jgi:tetratricopeptide (TPR) repeat protein
MEAWFGVSQKVPVVAFFFRSAEQKRQLMGAHSTYIAKPWMNQIYLQLEPWPHSAIAHEIAHIVVANTGAGPFRISGRWGGLWPNPALIEGVAVAAAWSDSREMTPHQWARAMIEIGLAPPLRVLFGMGFLGQPKRQAYTLVGSILRFVRDSFGARAIRRIYRTGDIESVVGMPFDELEKKWRQYVMSVALPQSALGLAKARFAKRTIFSSVCPHEVARLRSRLEADRLATQYKQAEETCREILQIDPSDIDAHRELITSFARDGEIKAAQRALHGIKKRNASPSLIALARQEIADAYWRIGREGEALRLYRSLVTLPHSNDTARVLEVKILALEGGAEQARLLRELLIGSDGMRPDGVTAIHLARELRDLRSDGLPYYLEARQLYFRQRFLLAATLLQRARQAALPTKRLRIEALRLEGIARYTLDQFATSKALFTRLEREAEGAYRVEARDWMERIRYTASHRESARSE